MIYRGIIGQKYVGGYKNKCINLTNESNVVGASNLSRVQNKLYYRVFVVEFVCNFLHTFQTNNKSGAGGSNLQCDMNN